MTDEQFKIAYPKVFEWISRLLMDNALSMQTVSSAGFRLLPRYFSSELLDSAKFVVVPGKPPVPPLSSMGLDQFAEFEKENLVGITYFDTFFLCQSQASAESLFFHELIHVVQWRLLGPERFLAAYADGYEKFGYRKAPLEVMAYSAEYAFAQFQVFDAEHFVRGQLRSSGEAGR